MGNKRSNSAARWASTTTKQFNGLKHKSIRRSNGQWLLGTVGRSNDSNNLSCSAHSPNHRCRNTLHHTNIGSYTTTFQMADWIKPKGRLFGEHNDQWRQCTSRTKQSAPPRDIFIQPELQSINQSFICSSISAQIRSIWAGQQGISCIDSCSKASIFVTLKSSKQKLLTRSYEAPGKSVMAIFTKNAHTIYMFPALNVMGRGSYLVGHGSYIRWVNGSWVNSNDPLPALTHIRTHTFWYYRSTAVY